MNYFVTSLLSYPFSLISQIKKLTKQQLFLMQSPLLYPAYPLMLFASGVSNVILSAWMIYDLIHREIHSCYQGVTLGMLCVILFKGIQILACIYPLYQLVMFLMLLVIIAKVQYSLIKLFLIILFPIILTSFGFGGLGIVYSCMVHSSNPIAIPYTFLIQNYFIQIIVYSMLVFVVLYLILVPLTVWLEERRDKNKQRTGCECCLFTMSIVFQVLLLVGFVVFMAIAIGGVPVLFYLLNGIRKTQPLTQEVFFGMAINSLASPFAVFCLGVFFTKVIGCGHQQQQMRTSLDESNELATQQAEQSHTTYSRNSKQDTLKRKSIDLDDEIVAPPDSRDSKRQVLLEAHLNRDFGQQGFGSKINQLHK